MLMLRYFAKILILFSVRTAQHRGSIRSSHPAVTGSNPDAPQFVDEEPRNLIFTRICLFEIVRHQCISKNDDLKHPGHIPQKVPNVAFVINVKNPTSNKLGHFWLGQVKLGLCWPPPTTQLINSTLGFGVWFCVSTLM